MSDTPWIVVDSWAQVMRCNRCGFEKPLSYINGKEVGEACRILNEFTENHKDCREEEQNGPVKTRNTKGP